jgi:DNA-binding beta-propeller fold protein YncE
MKVIFSALFAWALCAPTAGAVELLVADWSNDRILQFNGTTGAFQKELVSSGSGGLNNPEGMAVGPDGSLYVSSTFTNQVLRYDLNTGASLGVFATNADLPIGLKFGPDGDLYVASRGGDGVFRYDGHTGAPKGLFASAPTSVLWWAWDMEFGPNGDLFLSSFERGTILRFDGTTGALEGEFAAFHPGALSGMAFGPDGNLYVGGYSNNAVYEFDGSTGALLSTFASGNGLNRPSEVVFGPDGNLYVANERSNQILRFDGNTGAFLDDFTMGGNWAGEGASFLLFVPEPSTQALAACALAGLFVIRRQRTKGQV